MERSSNQKFKPISRSCKPCVSKASEIGGIMKELLCKHCGSPLKWKETYDTEGDLLGGYLLEKQFWCCPKCQASYYVMLECPFDNNNIKMTKFEEEA